MDRPRVLQLIETSGLGGAETIVLQLARGLRDRFEPIVGLLRDGWLQQSLAMDGTKTIRMRLRRPYDTRFVSELAACIRQEKVSLVHAHLFSMSIYGSMAARLAGVPSLFTVHGFEREFVIPRRLWAMRVAARLSRRIVCVSDCLRAMVAGRLRVSPTRVVRIYNGIDLSRFQVTPRNGPRPTVGCVGRLRPEKGHKDLIAAARLVTERVRDAHFLIVGDGPCRADLEWQSATLGLDGAVSFLGLRTDIAELLGTMHVFAVPSTSEGLSIATLEAQAAGLPVVVTDSGGPAEIVLHGQTGLIVPPGRPEAMAQAILSLLDDKQYAAYLGQQGRARVCELFSLERMLEEHGHLYDALINGGRRAAVAAQAEIQQ